MEFIFGVEDISGTKVHAYLKLAVKEKAPQIYARKGQVNKNLDKFTPDLLEGIQRNCAGILKKLNYLDLFPKIFEDSELKKWYEDNGVPVPEGSLESKEKFEGYIQYFNDFNSAQIGKTQNNIVVNQSAGYLRNKPSPGYPKGRNGNKASITKVRKEVTVYDKTTGKLVKERGRLLGQAPLEKHDSAP